MSAGSLRSRSCIDASSASMRTALPTRLVVDSPPAPRRMTSVATASGIEIAPAFTAAPIVPSSVSGGSAIASMRRAAR